MNDKRKKHLESVLPELIKAYNSSYKKQYIDGLNECNKVLMAENLTNTEKARYMLKGSHHYRMPDKDHVSQILGDACLWERKYHNFEKVYEAVENTIGELYGVGPLALYDVSVRIAYCCGIEPKSYVYLQCGALVGARRLLDDKKLRVGTIDATCFEELLPGLSPLHVENFLCHMQDDFLDESERKKEPRKRRCYRYRVCVMLIGLLFSLLTPLSALADVTIDEEHFPDENFRAYLLAQDYGEDGVITDEEIAGITKINVRSKSINSLEGIQHFTALTYLDCYNNQLTALDVSNNTALTYLGCNSNQLTELNVSGCTGLTELIHSPGHSSALKVIGGTTLQSLTLNNGQITSLDVSECTALTYLRCDNNQLTSLDVTQNTALTTLWCNSNQLTTLDVSECTALTYLRCDNNQLTSLDVSKNTALTSLFCDYNQLTSLDVTQNMALTYLDCYRNQLTELNVSGCIRLTKLTYYTDQSSALKVIGGTTLQSLTLSPGQITSLDVSECTALTELSCGDNQLTALDVTQNTALTYLSCGSNQLTALDVSKNTALTTLYCHRNQLTNLNVSGCTALTHLYCSSNQLTALDVSGCTALTYLDCDNNQLTKLDISNNTALWYLDCSNNQLTNLNVSGCTALTTLECFNNQIYGEEMDKFIESLREYDGFIHNIFYGAIRIFDSYSDTEGNICTWNQADAIKAKGWSVYKDNTKYDGLTEWNVEMHEGQGEYWATLYAPFGYTLPEGTEAYVGTLNENNQTLKMTSIGREVPRGVPVVIKGNSTSVVAEVDDDITAEVGDYDLVGMYEPFDATGTDVYTLGIYEEIVGFYKDKGTTERFKAVLELPEGIAANGYRMVFEDDDITAIEDASVIMDNANAVYYDLQGRRVAEPQKGQLYIVNGKTTLYQP